MPSISFNSFNERWFVFSCKAISNFIQVFNKTDQVDNNNQLNALKKKYPKCVFISAKNNIGTECLKDKIKKFYFDKEYLEACKSCNGRDHNVAAVDAAIQTKNPIQYTEVS